MKCFEFEVTYRCNTVCEYCNRLLGVIDLPDSDLTVAQTEHACRALKQADWVPDKVKLSGGEPIVNKQLPEIREVIRRELNPTRLWTLTNSTATSEQYQENVVQLGGHHWHPSPLPKQHHDPFLISPTEEGLADQMDIPACTIRRLCGRSVDAYGFSFCPLAPMLGRLLRINPYRSEPWVEGQDERICRHCPHAIPEVKQPQLFEIAKTKRYPSPIYVEGLKKWRQEPYRLERMEPCPRSPSPLI